MRTPVTAMLWELWRLTRVEAACRIALAASVGMTILWLVRGDNRDIAATAVLILVAFLALPFWFSIVSLNGGRLRDGGPPGFPFRLGYVRPVGTSVLVIVPMAYLAVAAAATYLIPVIVLGAVFDYSFPLLPVAAWIAVLTLVQAAASWWTGNKVIQMLGSMGAVGACVTLAINRIHGEEIPGNDFLPDRWPIQFAFSLEDYGIIASIAVSAIVLTFVSVARQRHGDMLVDVPRAGRTQFPTLLVDAFRVPCPTATALRAQLWFEMKSAGGPVLTIGGALALAIPVLLVVVDPVGPARGYAALFVMFSPLLVLALVTNPLGLRRKQGHTYASSFELTQAVGTVPLAALKVLVRAASVLVALAAVSISLWISVPLVSEWTQVPWGNYGNLVQGRRAVAAAVDGLAGHQLAALAIVAATGLSAAIAYVASIQVFWLLRPWPTMVGVLGMSLFSLASLLAAPAGVGGDGLEVRLIGSYQWMVTVAVPLGTLHVFRQALTARLFTIRHAAGAVVLWAGFLAVWLIVLHGFGLRLAEMSPALIASMLSLSLLPLAAMALTPWSLNLLRHT